MIISLDSNTGVHSYSSYGILDFLGDLGGVLEIMYFITANLMAPIASYSYTIKALEKLFVARTVDSKMFSERKETEENIKKKRISKSPSSLLAIIQADLVNMLKGISPTKRHYKIKLSFFNKIKLFILSGCATCRRSG